MTEDPERMYHVVVNDEEQYSIWLADQPTPAGWYLVGEPQPKPDCLARINELWTDLRPKSSRSN